ncbi:MAG: hypothetical protein SGILL_003450 [Bacillariaceae sp.]
MDFYEANSIFTLLAFDIGYEKMKEDLGPPVSPSHTYFRNDAYRERLVVEFNKILVGPVTINTLMRMAGYKHEEMYERRIDSYGKLRSCNTWQYERNRSRIKSIRDATRIEKKRAFDSLIPEVYPEVNHSAVSLEGQALSQDGVLGFAKGNHNLPSKMQPHVGHYYRGTNGGIMKLHGAPNTLPSWTDSASGKENSNGYFHNIGGQAIHQQVFSLR